MEQKTMRALLANGKIRVLTDGGEFELTGRYASSGGSCAVLENDHVRMEASVFDKGGETVYRGVKVECRENLTLYRLEYELEIPEGMREFIFYRSFIDAPAAAFIRCEGAGFFTGAENPFFEAACQDGRITVAYEPSLILKKGEVYEAEPQFMGRYTLTGRMIRECEPMNLDAVKQGIWRPRFYNPCGEIALDMAEIEAMRRYVIEYMDVTEKRFDSILYFYFYPKKQLPETEKEVEDYLSTIDRFREIDGDIIAFNPHVNTVIPDESRPFWELAPAGSQAERILRYAQEKGLRCGYYMGCAFNGGGGNAALLPYRPDKPEWKKVDDAGQIAGENCLGCDEYADWYFTVQRNTIEKYNLGYWAWDPGPGNGNDCWAENHGHIPGRGEYKGWRNSVKLLERLKREFPRLFLMSFYGRKEYGIWGFRYFSQHEVYWEQTILFGATLHNDLHDDRVNAHGTRLQNAWSMNFRFLPAHLGHGLVPRMGESSFDPMIERAYDHGGWKYALISALACCGSVTLCTLPDRLENLPGFTEFYRKWLRWARENYRYCDFVRPIADRVSNEVIDGFSRIDRDSGQIFLFNSSPKAINKRLPLDDALGLDTEESFFLRILYCDGMEETDEAVQYGGMYRMGDVLDITLPPYGAVVLELSQEAARRIDRIEYRRRSIDVFTDEAGEIFGYPRHPAHDRITLTARVVFRHELREALLQAHTAHEDFLKGQIPKWHEEGLPFTFTSALPNRLPLYIPFNGPKQPKSVRLFVGEREVPVEVYRLWQTPVSRCAFVEDAVEWGVENIIRLEIEGLAENSFMGLYADYTVDCDGIAAEERIFPEEPIPSGLHPDGRLLIDSFSIEPDTLTDRNAPFTVTVRTQVPPEEIEEVIFLHPTMPMMPALTYDSERNVWQGRFNTGKRSGNIFVNTEIYARIRAKNGGVGPTRKLNVRTRYIRDPE